MSFIIRLLQGDPKEEKKLLIKGLNFSTFGLFGLFAFDLLAGWGLYKVWFVAACMVWFLFGITLAFVHVFGERLDKLAKRMKADNQAQLTIIGLFTMFILIIIFFALLPTLNSAIDQALPSLGPTEQTLIRLIPLSFVVAILGGIFFFARAGE